MTITLALFVIIMGLLAVLAVLRGDAVEVGPELHLELPVLLWREIDSMSCVMVQLFPVTARIEQRQYAFLCRDSAVKIRCVEALGVVVLPGKVHLSAQGAHQPSGLGPVHGICEGH